MNVLQCLGGYSGRIYKCSSSLAQLLVYGSCLLPKRLLRLRYRTCSITVNDHQLPSSHDYACTPAGLSLSAISFAILEQSLQRRRMSRCASARTATHAPRARATSPPRVSPAPAPAPPSARICLDTPFHHRRCLPACYFPRNTPHKHAHTADLNIPPPRCQNLRLLPHNRLR
jgi:hypothetical protein